MDRPGPHSHRSRAAKSLDRAIAIVDFTWYITSDVSYTSGASIVNANGCGIGVEGSTLELRGFCTDNPGGVSFNSIGKR